MVAFGVFATREANDRRASVFKHGYDVVAEAVGIRNIVFRTNPDATVYAVSEILNELTKQKILEWLLYGGPRERGSQTVHWRSPIKNYLPRRLATPGAV